MALLPGGLIQPNATVRIEVKTVTQDIEGGTQEAYTTLKDGVRVLVSEVSGARTDGLGGEHNKLSGTMSGPEKELARADVRFVITKGPYGLTGIFLYPESYSVHGATGAGIMRAAPFYRVKWSSVRPT